EATMGWPPEGRGIITGPDGDLGGVTTACCPDGRAEGCGGGGGGEAEMAPMPITVGRRAGACGGAGGVEAAGRSSCGTGICRYCSSLADSCSISAAKTFFIHDARSLRE